MNRKHFSFALSRLAVALIVLSTVSAVSACVLFFAQTYSKSLLRAARINSEQTVGQATLSLDNYLSSLKGDLDRICLLMPECESVEDFGTKMAAFCKLQPDIYAVTVYNESGVPLLCVSDGLELKQNRYTSLVYDSTYGVTADGYTVSPPHVQMLFRGEYPWVVTVSAENDGALFGEKVRVALDVRFYEIAGYIDHIGLGRHGYCYVTDKNGNILYHPAQQLLYAGIRAENADVAALSDGVHSYNGTMYTLGTTSDGVWRVVGVSFTDELAADRRTQILNAVLLAFVCCFAVSLAALVLFSRLVNRPVKQLIRAMREFEKGAKDFEYRAGENSVAELQELSDSFAHMSERIKLLVKRVKADQTALRKTELKALQAQINPHFLYNTLDSIQWMCESGNTESAVKMVGALAKLFRISISRGREFITVKEETEHARSYLIIQSYRYKDQFSYHIDIELGLENYLCNKITIQPLVENAIYHGIDRMVDEGEIRICAFTAPDCQEDILITISDNGVGMTAEQCAKILQKEKSDSSGIGVKNVNDRLKIYFGQKYGLSIKSELDAGTTVTVRIPKITKEPENDA